MTTDIDPIQNTTSMTADSVETAPSIAGGQAVEPTLSDPIELPNFSTNPSIVQDRRAARSYQNSLTPNFETTTAERRPLSQRDSIDRMFRFSTSPDPVDPSFQTLEVSPIGGVNKQGRVGSRQPRQVKVNNERLLQSAQPLANYAAYYQNMSVADRNFQGVHAFFDSVAPFIQADDFDGDFTKEEVDRFNNVRNSIGEGLDTFNLFNNWDRLNDAGKVRGTANQLVGTAQALGYKAPGQVTSPLAGLNFAYSSHKLINDWDNLTEEQRAVGTVNTIVSGVQAYQGASALAQSFSAASSAASAGGAAASAGSAASAGASGSSAGGAAGASTGSEFLSTASTYLSYAGAAIGAYNMVDQYGTGGADGRVNGAMNGAAIGMMFGPWGAAIGAALGVAIGSISNGKHIDQVQRDAYRGAYEKAGLYETIDGSHNVQLSDGSFYDVGVDGSENVAQFQGSDKAVYDPARIAERDRGNFARGDTAIRPYDIDYTSDLDFHVSMAATGVAAILNGGSSTKATGGRQMGGYLTNAATSNLGSREFSQENFEGAMANVRGFYESIGITDFDSAVELVNQMYEDEKLTEDDFNAIRIGLHYAFEDDFARAQTVNHEIRGPVEGGRTDSSRQDWEQYQENQREGVQS